MADGMDRGRSVMTPEEVRAYCEQTGQAVPSMAPRKRGPRAKIALDMGEGHGSAVLTVECHPSARLKWREWLMARQESLGGKLVEW